MGGTALQVLSPYTVERVEPILIEEMFAEGLTRYGPDPSYWHCADGLPFGYDLQKPDVEIDPEELQLVLRATGRQMRCDIGIHIFVSDLAGRPVLARVAQRVARRCDGWVFVEFHDRPSTDLLDHLCGVGRCVRVDDAVYLDAQAMAAWITHPQFHVVK
ncbi:hypothetical protein [Micromonospora endolithica]|uniref:Uncharacterized protein n=1 Tax=Micromonospora endolithica TaxID=230091 RepID=A0A3A9ZI81_9ACTN|nr:hypothetical protein [Micromonospora endolithica]RKN47514.1 hypothetical protein D7223_12065 [Micromonospora endolithica]TWJ21151.1 hypothetical protein JD76_01261 [Micromonospora endolithica]